MSKCCFNGWPNTLTATDIATDMYLRAIANPYPNPRPQLPALIVKHLCLTCKCKRFGCLSPSLTHSHSLPLSLSLTHTHSLSVFRTVVVGLMEHTRLALITLASSVWFCHLLMQIFVTLLPSFRRGFQWVRDVDMGGRGVGRGASGIYETPLNWRLRRTQVRQALIRVATWLILILAWLLRLVHVIVTVVKSFSIFSLSLLFLAFWKPFSAGFIGIYILKSEREKYCHLFKRLFCWLATRLSWH